MSCVTAAAPSTVSISYTPENMVQPVKGAGAVTVTVNDLRADRDKVGNTTGLILKAGNGVINTAESVELTVKTATESEFINRGFTLSGGTASVKIDVSQFDVQHVLIWHHNELFARQSYNSEAKVLMHMEVTGVGGKHLYSRLVFGLNDSDKDSDQRTLDLALQKALRDLFDDPNFIGQFSPPGTDNQICDDCFGDRSINDLRVSAHGRASIYAPSGKGSAGDDNRSLR
jgi:hypothetical protein